MKPDMEDTTPRTPSAPESPVSSQPEAGPDMLEMPVGSPAEQQPPRAAGTPGRVLFLYLLLLVALALFEAPRLASTLDDLTPDFPPAAMAAQEVRALARQSGATALSEHTAHFFAQYTAHETLGTVEDAEDAPGFAAEGSGSVATGKQGTQNTTAPDLMAASGNTAANGTERGEANATSVAGSLAHNGSASAAHNATAAASATAPGSAAGAAPLSTNATGKVLRAANGTCKPLTLAANSTNRTMPAGNGTCSPIAGNATALAGNGTCAAPAGPAKPVILLVGDSMMMEGIGPALLRSLRQREDIEVVREAKYSTGLSRMDFFDWPAYMQELVTKYSPALVVICLGANDAQDIIDNDKKRHFVGTPSWEQCYLERSEQLIAVAQSGGAKVMWVGLPVMGNPNHAQHILQLSAQQKAACQNSTSRSFVDTLPILADEKGNYATFLKGPDGALTRIRYKDKIHVNDVGGRMLADFVLPYIEKVMPRVPVPKAEPAEKAANVPQSVATNATAGAAPAVAPASASKAEKPAAHPAAQKKGHNASEAAQPAGSSPKKSKPAPAAGKANATKATAPKPESAKQEQAKPVKSKAGAVKTTAAKAGTGKQATPTPAKAGQKKPPAKVAAEKKG